MGQETEVVKSETETPKVDVSAEKIQVAKVETAKVEKPVVVKIEDTTAKVENPIEVKTDASIKIEKAKAIFEVMPHITTIWFDKNGDWRFYSTPGSTPINKNKS
ncbi:MAG: hypothetical protein M3Z26_00545 [Bacteroidota bacterium]|nr:hypothetical protein [Bacteroidota bacterium]